MLLLPVNLGTAVNRIMRRVNRREMIRLRVMTITDPERRCPERTVLTRRRVNQSVGRNAIVKFSTPLRRTRNDRNGLAENWMAISLLCHRGLSPKTSRKGVRSRTKKVVVFSVYFRLRNLRNVY